MNDCAAVSRAVGEGNGRKPAEQELQMLANCYLKQKDSTGYVAAIERLVTYYPKKEYWTDLLNRVQKKSGFSDRLALDVFRLKLATGNVTSAGDYLEMAQLAIQAGFPAEAKAIVDKGYAAKALGTGKDAERHQRLRDLVAKRIAESAKARDQVEKDALADKGGDALVSLGYSYVTEGAAQKGLAFMEQGIKKGGLKRPEDAKLLLGMAQLQNGSKSRGLADAPGRPRQRRHGGPRAPVDSPRAAGLAPAIRHATQADLAAIVAIYNASIPGRLATADTAPVTVDSRREWFAAFDPASRPIWVAEDRGPDRRMAGASLLLRAPGLPPHGGSRRLRGSRGAAPRGRPRAPRPRHRRRPGAGHLHPPRLRLRPQ